VQPLPFRPNAAALHGAALAQAISGGRRGQPAKLLLELSLPLSSAAGLPPPPPPTLLVQFSMQVSEVACACQGLPQVATVTVMAAKKLQPVLRSGLVSRCVLSAHTAHVASSSAKKTKKKNKKKSKEAAAEAAAAGLVGPLPDPARDHCTPFAESSEPSFCSQPFEFAASRPLPFDLSSTTFSALLESKALEPKVRPNKTHLTRPPVAAPPRPYGLVQVPAALFATSLDANAAPNTASAAPGTPGGNGNADCGGRKEFGTTVEEFAVMPLVPFPEPVDTAMELHLPVLSVQV
jgi:hypothetical protein